MTKISNKTDNFWVIIPARSGSKKIKNKNIIKFKGKPLLAHSIISGKKLKLGKVVVSSDSKEYLKIAFKFGADLLHLRPKKFSKDKTSDLEVFKNFLAYVKKKKITPPRFVHCRSASVMSAPDKYASDKFAYVKLAPLSFVRPKFAL